MHLQHLSFFLLLLIGMLLLIWIMCSAASSYIFKVYSNVRAKKEKKKKKRKKKKREKNKTETFELFCLFSHWHAKVFSSKHITLKVDVLKDRKIYCLQARPCIFQPGNVTCWSTQGVNGLTNKPETLGLSR